MKKLFFIVIIILINGSINAQRGPSNLCKVEVNDVSKVTSFGYLIGYSVTFKNNSKKTVDGIYWDVYYYNNDNELIKKDNSSFNSTKIIDPIASGFTKTLARSPRIKGASVVVIIIKKVHFSDGTSCN
jgi:hypothetical protein